MAPVSYRFPRKMGYDADSLIDPGQKGKGRLTDEELFARVKAGDGDALSELYDRYLHKVYAIARRVVVDAQVAEEVVQDVFTRIWTTTAFRPELGKFEHWIYVVARRIAIDHVRRRERAVDWPDSERVDRGADESATFDGELLADALRADLVRSLQALRPEERIVLQKAYFEGHTLSEIAADLAIPLGTVKTRLHHGLRVMRAGMADWKPEVLR